MIFWGVFFSAYRRGTQQSGAQKKHRCGFRHLAHDNIIAAFLGEVSDEMVVKPNDQVQVKAIGCVVSSTGKTFAFRRGI